MFPARWTTPRCHVRPLEPADAPALLRHFGDPRVAEFLDQAPLQRLEEAEEILDWAERLDAAGTGVRWAILRNGDSRFLGTVGFHAVVPPPTARGEIGFDLDPEEWGQGLMSEVLEGALQAAFDEARLHRVQALVTPGNERSCRRLESLGFQREGVLRDVAYWSGRHHDQVTYSLLAPEWRGPARR